MKVIHLISGGDSGGAKTHVHMLLQNLSRTIDVTMVCFMEGPFAQEARELGIHTIVLPGHNLLHTFHTSADAAVLPIAVPVAVTSAPFRTDFIVAEPFVRPST